MAKRPMHPSVTIDRLLGMAQDDDCEGVCLACGETAYGVEPNARRYTCEECNEKAVYGAEELLIMLA